VSPVYTHLRYEFLKIITSKNFLAEFTLALCVVLKKFLFMSNIGKVSFGGGRTIDRDLPVSCSQLFGRSQQCFGLYQNLFLPQYDQQLFVSQHFLGHSPLQRILPDEGN
jgi:hypothetical protein